MSPGPLSGEMMEVLRRKGLLGPKELSEYLNLPVSTLYRQHSRGEGVGALGLRVGRHLRWRFDEVEAHLDAQRKKSARAS